MSLIKTLDYEKTLDSDMFYTREEIYKEYKIIFPGDVLNVKKEEIFEMYKDAAPRNISRFFLGELIRVPGLYQYLYNNMDNEIPIAININLFKDGEVIDNITITRIELVKTLKKEINNLGLTSDEKIKAAIIIALTTSNSLRAKHGSNIVKTIIDGKTHVIEVNKLIDILYWSELTYRKMIVEDPQIKEKAYLLVDYFERKRILEKYELSDEAYQRYQNIKSMKDIDYESLNKNKKTNEELTVDVSLITINEELLEKITEDLPIEYSPLEKAIYIYIKMCQTLTFDEKYYASGQNEKYKLSHEDLTRLYEITPENNKIINFDFMIIYARILRMLNIDYTFNSYFGNEAFPQLTFRSGEYLLEVKGLRATLNNDIALAKNVNKIIGIRCTNKNQITHEKFKELLEKIIDKTIMQDEIKEEYEDALSTYEEVYVSNVLPDHEKIKLLIEAISKKKVIGFDALAYIKKISKNILGENYFVSFVCDKDDDYTPYVIITGLTNNEYHYAKISVDGKHHPELISKEELETKFINKQYYYIEEQEIPGLSLEKGKHYVRFHS